MKFTWFKILVFTLALFSRFTSVSQTNNTVGLKLNSESSFNGFTLLNPVNSTTTYLLDNCGFQVNSWTSIFNPGLSAYITEQGTLMRTGRINGSFNAGGAGGMIQEFDWEGNLIWEIQLSNQVLCQHHDIEILPNGNILVLLWEYNSPNKSISLGRIPNLVSANGIWTEMIYEIKPIGSNDYDIVWEWHMNDHLVQDINSDLANFGIISSHPELIDINFNVSQNVVDLFHANNIDYNEEYDQILINVRNTNELYIIDHSTSIQEAASHSGGNANMGGDILYRYGNPAIYDRGDASDQKFYLQHGSRWITGTDSEFDNQIIVFNNGSGRPEGDFSSIEVLKPPRINQSFSLEEDEAFGPEEFSFIYVGMPVSSLFSPRISNASMLPNKNILVCDGQAGRIFEINHSKEIVWEYINPVFGGFIVTQGSQSPMSDVFAVDRYATDFRGFENVDLSPSSPIEINSVYNCDIYETEVSVHDEYVFESVFLTNNPVIEVVRIKNMDARMIGIHIHDIFGSKLLQVMSTNEINIDIPFDFENGYYLITIEDFDAKRIKTFKFLKI